MNENTRKEEEEQKTEIYTAVTDALIAHFGDRAVNVARRQFEHAEIEAIEFWKNILAALERSPGI